MMAGRRPAMVLAAAVLAALSTAAGAQLHNGPRPMSTTEFVDAAQQSDQYETLSSQLALIASTSPAVRGFAQQMIADHAGTTQTLHQAVAKSGMTPPPPSLSGDQARMLGALQSTGAAEFDKAYVRQQVLAHRQALVVEQDYAAKGADANIRGAAAAAVPIVQHHLDMAQRMAATLGAS